MNYGVNQDYENINKKDNLEWGGIDLQQMVLNICNPMNYIKTKESENNGK